MISGKIWLLKDVNNYISNLRDEMVEEYEYLKTMNNT